jgi:hypothetical protein
MMLARNVLLGMLATVAGAAQAEVKSSSRAGFDIENKRIVAASAAAAYAGTGRVSAWWNKGHTYSGDAGNLSLGL